VLFTGKPTTQKRTLIQGLNYLPIIRKKDAVLPRHRSCRLTSVAPRSSPGPPPMHFALNPAQGGGWDLVSSPRASFRRTTEATRPMPSLTLVML
jgi:hypothetical protein